VVQDYPKYFRSFAEAGYKAGEFYKEQGRYFKIVPASKTFRGKLYILTDSRTSGPSSALICLLKRNKIGTIVGQGASVSSGISERIMINSDFSLSLVVSEFYTPDNRTINRSDLEPDIILRDEDALTYVLRNL
jgi:C-terminal processing protease CtpA/Prc